MTKITTYKGEKIYIDGTANKRSNGRLTMPFKMLLAKEFKEGKSIQSMQEETGVSQATIRSFLEGQGLYTRLYSKSGNKQTPLHYPSAKPAGAVAEVISKLMADREKYQTKLIGIDAALKALRGL